MTPSSSSSPPELASPLTRTVPARHSRADRNGSNSLKSSGKNGYRTLQSFATKDLGSEEFGAINNGYWGSTTYADDEISAALDGTGDYASAADVTREQVAKKVLAYTAV